MSKRRFFIFLLTLFLSALCGTVLFADEADPANPGSESTAVSDAGADWNDDADTDSDDDLKRIEKWIPDQKILIGAPPMVVPLTGVIAQFRREGAFGDPARSGDVYPSASDVYEGRDRFLRYGIGQAVAP